MQQTSSSIYLDPNVGSSTHPIFSKQQNTKSYPSNSYPILSRRLYPSKSPRSSRIFAPLPHPAPSPAALSSLETKRVIVNLPGSKIPTTFPISVFRSGKSPSAPCEVVEGGKRMLDSKEA